MRSQSQRMARPATQGVKQQFLTRSERSVQERLYLICKCLSYKVHVQHFTTSIFYPVSHSLTHIYCNYDRVSLF